MLRLNKTHNYTGGICPAGTACFYDFFILFLYSLGLHPTSFLKNLFTYKTNIKLEGERDVRLRVNLYRGALVRVSVDGVDYGELVFAPYEKDIKNLSAGEHTIEFKLFGTRVNTFSALHNCNRSEKWKGPSYWYSQNDSWSYEYCLKETGILASPIIEVYDG